MTLRWRARLVKALLEPDESKRATLLRRSAFQAGCRGFEPRLPLLPLQLTLLKALLRLISRNLRLLCQIGIGRKTGARTGALLMGNRGGVRTPLPGGRAVVQSEARCSGGISCGVTADALLVGVGSWHDEPARPGGQIYLLRTVHCLATNFISRDTACPQNGKK
jgi:hypothetical protein